LFTYRLFGVALLPVYVLGTATALPPGDGMPESVVYEVELVDVVPKAA
jgi:hypothetical protein